jgi:hypothetical protein
MTGKFSTRYKEGLFRSKCQVRDREYKNMWKSRIVVYYTPFLVTILPFGFSLFVQFTRMVTNSQDNRSSPTENR